MNKEQVIKIDRFAEQIAEEAYKMFAPVSIDEPGALGKEGLYDWRNSTHQM